MSDTYIGHMAIRAADEKDGEEEIRRIRGIASTGNPDRANTWVNPKSLVKAAKQFDRRQGKMFWNHSWAIPIGVREALEVVDDKLHFQGRIGKGFPVPVPVGFLGVPALMNVDDLWNIMKQGLTTSLSIAFMADETPGEKEADSGKRGPSELTVTDLLEVSVVTIPANPDCEFQITRGMFDPEYAAAIRAFRRELNRQDLYDWKLDGAAAAAAVGLEGGAVPEVDELEPVKQLDRSAESENWLRVREELEKCRLSLRTKS